MSEEGKLLELFYKHVKGTLEKAIVKSISVRLCNFKLQNESGKVKVFRVYIYALV